MDNRRSSLLVFTLLIGGVVAGLVVFLNQGAMVGSAAAPIVMGIAILGIAAVIIAKRKRRQSMPDTDLASLGLHYVPSVEKGFHRRFGKLPGIPKGGKVSNVLKGEIAGGELTAFQHYYMTMAGQTPIPVYHAVYVTEAPNWPMTTIARRNPFGKLFYRFGMRRGLMLELDAFNAGMKVTAEDEDLALMLLGPGMQRFLLEQPRIVWRIGSGYVAMIYSGQLKFDRAASSVERLRRFWDLVPTELNEW